MNLELLKPFCSTDYTRFVLALPSSLGKFTYATDGRIMVRVPRLPDVPEVERYPKVEPTWDDFPKVDPEAMRPAPSLDMLPVPARNLCEECRGTGNSDGLVCECCGRLPACDACDGNGYIDDEKFWADVDGAAVDVAYLRKIAALPNAKFAVVAVAPNSRFRFIFDGGEGVLMGLAKAEDEDRRVKL